MWWHWRRKNGWRMRLGWWHWRPLGFSVEGFVLAQVEEEWLAHEAGVVALVPARSRLISMAADGSIRAWSAALGAPQEQLARCAQLCRRLLRASRLGRSPRLYVLYSMRLLFWCLLPDVTAAGRVWETAQSLGRKAPCLDGVASWTDADTRD